MKRKTLLQKTFDLTVNFDFFYANDFGFAQTISVKFCCIRFMNFKKFRTFSDFTDF